MAHQLKSSSQNLGLIENVGPDLKLVAAPGVADVNIPATFSKRMILKDRPIRVAIASFDASRGRVEQIEKLSKFAPGHNPVNLIAIRKCRSREPEVRRRGLPPSRSTRQMLTVPE